MVLHLAGGSGSLLCGHLRIIIADTNVDMQRDIVGYSVRDTRHCQSRTSAVWRCAVDVMQGACCVSQDQSGARWRVWELGAVSVWQCRRVSAGWQHRALRCEACVQRAVNIAGVSAIIMQRVSQHSASQQLGSDIGQAHTLTSQMTAYAVRVMMCSSLHSEMVDEIT